MHCLFALSPSSPSPELRPLPGCTVQKPRGVESSAAFRGLADHFGGLFEVSGRVPLVRSTLLAPFRIDS